MSVPRMAMLCLSLTSGAPSTRAHGPSLQFSPMIEYRTTAFFCSTRERGQRSSAMTKRRERARESRKDPRNARRGWRCRARWPP